MTRLDVPSPAPATAADGLAQDTELLSNTLIEVLEEQAGRVFASRLQWLFRTAAAVRAGDTAAAERLVAYLGGVPDESVEPIIRACSLELQLANIAEERERVRRRRQYDATGAVQRESLAETAEILKRNEVDIAPLAAQLQIEHVLTAHPTEATRRSVLDHQWDVAALLDRLDDPRTGHARRRSLLEELREVLTLWWQTDELRRIRPRVEDEVRRNLFFFEAVLFDAVPAVLAEIEHALAVRLVQPVLSYGSWTGGDMDGHPEVGADTLARALSLHRTTALRLFRTRVDNLARAFSHSSLRVPVSEELNESLERDGEELPSAAVLRRPHREWEPLRTKLGFVHHRLGNTLTPRGREPGYADAQALRRDIELVLAHVNSRHVALGSIRRLLWQIDVFGFHLAGIDIRQGAGVVREATGAILPGYADADEARRQALLTEALASGRRGIEFDPGDEAGELLRVLDTVALSDRGLRAAGRARVRDLDDRAAVRRARGDLARAPGGGDRGPDGAAVRDPRGARGGAGHDGRAVRLRALRRAPAHAGQPPDGDGRLLGLRQGHGLHRVLVGAAQRAGATGAPGRRRGHFARALPRPRRLAVARRRADVPRDPGPARGHGQRAHPDHRTGRDGLRPLRRRGAGGTLAGADRVGGAAGVARCRIRRCGTSGARRWSGCRHARASATAALVYDDPEFLRFFGQVAPIAELSQLNLGSRPPSRKGSAGVESLRAIPWVFAWTQNRLLLPSWYGAGAALEAGDLSLQREMWRDWPFFRGLIGTLEMALFKSDLGVAERYLTLVDEDIAQRFWDDLRAEYDSVVERVLTVTGQGRLLDETPALQSRLEHRNPWIDPLSHLQVELLRRVRGGREEARAPLLATITGIAAGMRNTG